MAEEAHQRWVTSKSSCDMYYYTSAFSSVYTDWETTIEITAGTVTKRVHKQYSVIGGDARVLDGTWTEVGTDVGSHAEGAAPKTMDALYLDCEHDVLSRDRRTNEVTFEADERGVLRQCWFSPHGCATDCRMGVIVTEFACGPIVRP